jgi:hypothetical protein
VGTGAGSATSSFDEGAVPVQNELVPTDRLDEQRPALTGEVKRLGDHPGVIRVTADGATVEVAAKAEDTELLLGPYRKPADVTAARSERL